MFRLCVVTAALTLAACNLGEADLPESAEATPTQDLTVDPPDVDTGWPEFDDDTDVGTDTDTSS